jgi:palmitoyltransferase
MQSAIHYETNGFEDPVIGWPPPDPDRMPRPPRNYDDKAALTYRQNYDDGDIVAFRLRQQEDLKRFNQNESAMRKRQQFHQRYDPSDNTIEKDLAPGEEGEESWRNAEGERLADFGVDEDVEFYDEENIPLAELIQRRKVSGKVAMQGQEQDGHNHAIGSARHPHAL